MKKILGITLLFLQTIAFSQEKQILRTYSTTELYNDFDLMVTALKEAHPGLYWYQSIPEFDSIVNSERTKIKEGMNSYDFFRIASKIVTATKEGHCRIGSSKDVGEYFNEKALILPVIVKSLNGKLYILNDIENQTTKGKILTKINNTPIETVLETIFTYSPRFADGYIKTGKIRYNIDYAKLAYCYSDYFANQTINEIELLDPKNNQISTIKVNAFSAKDFRKIEELISYPKFKNPIDLDVDVQKSVAKFFIHTFNHKSYSKEGDETIAFKNFTSKVDSVFTVLKKGKIKNLIIDIRNNGGGTEGYEDYVFSYLTDKPYSKYKYVQANSLTYSFMEHTQYNTLEKKQVFKKDMKDEFYLENDGRYLRKENFMKVEPPKKEPFRGGIFVLISGKTYSGGSEFAGLLKSKTEAIFIGEETAGGFYGRTSGFGLTLTLPNTKTNIRIPLLKFVSNFENKEIAIGRGIIPNYEVQPTYEEYSIGKDSEMEFAMKLITNKK